MNYRATNPARVGDKINECRFFLAQMADHEKAGDIEKFMYCLSAFLSSFRSGAFRLIGVVHTVRGKTGRDGLLVQLKSKTDIWFLKDRTDLEVHGDGAIVWPRYTRRSREYSSLPVAARTSGNSRTLTNSSCRQFPIKLLGFSLTVVQLPFLILSRCCVHQRDVLVARVIIHAY
jgi:hypothetical protein